MRFMSSDGATDKPRPARPGRSDDRGLASIALGLLLILAVVATVVMIFSDNPVWMRVGTLAALWAAFIGAFLVARYRRQAASEAARVRDLHTVYELQLEREISARREHELVVEKDLRDTVRSETSDSILALRQEIAALREQLGALGVTLPEDRFAVGGLAPAGELGAGSLPSVPSERVEPRRRVSEPSVQPDPASARAYTSSSSTPTAAPTPPAPPTADAPTTPAPAAAGASVSGVGPDATPSTERTEKFSPVDAARSRTEAPAEEPRRPEVRPAGDPGRASRRSAETVAPSSEPAARPARPARSDRPAARPAAAAEQPTSDRAQQPKAEPARQHEEESVESPQAESVEPVAPSAPPSRHGQGTGMSVAELMAKLGGDDAPSGVRRRRRAED